MVDDLFEHQLYDWNDDKINNVQLEEGYHGIRGNSLQRALSCHVSTLVYI